MTELNIYQNQPYPTEPMLNVSVEWVTQITENRSGKENRIPKITEPQYSIEGSDFALKDEDFAVFAQAFIDAEGKNNPFPFKCPLDYYCKAEGEFYDVGSFQRGILWAIDSLNYQIVKQYKVGGVSTFKTITLPVNGTIHIYEGGVEVFPSVNLSTGVVTFASPPSGGLTIDCEFRLPMRFDVDDNQLNQIKRAVNSIYSANDTSIYLAVNFRLLEDMNYARLSPLVIGGNLTYDFDGHPLSDVSYSDRSLTRIQSSDSLRETRDGLNVFRKKYAIANNNMNWVNTQKYFTLFMACKGRLLPFTFEGSLVRLDSDIFSVSMIGYSNVDLRPTSKIDNETYIITFIDGTSLTPTEISNIQAAIAELRILLASTVYGSTALANKYVKPPITYMDERYLIWPVVADYRDSPTEPEKYLMLPFVDETNRVFDSSPESTDNSYHYIPRNISVEPTNLWLSDYDAFVAKYPDFAKFYCLLFSPTGSPPKPSEIAFNPHIVDAVNGNGNYAGKALVNYGWTAKPNWDENASGADIYAAIAEFIFGSQG